MRTARFAVACRTSQLFKINWNSNFFEIFLDRSLLKVEVSSESDPLLCEVVNVKRSL